MGLLCLWKWLPVLGFYKSCTIVVLGGGPDSIQHAKVKTDQVSALVNAIPQTQSTVVQVNQVSVVILLNGTRPSRSSKLQLLAEVIM